jgi:ATP-dependent helicase/nuclease subunit B
MLILQAISGPKDQQALLAEFDPQPGTWVVSDLKSKLDLQRRLMKSRDFISGESVLRASELWKILLTRLRPDIQVVSKEFSVTLISEELSTRSEAWAQSPGAAQTAYKYMCQLMPILSHPQGGEMMSSWFEKHEASKIRWGRWFQVCTELWAKFLDRGIVAAPWVSGVLVNEVGFEKVWNRPLIFDLGAEMNQVEADLIALLGNFVPITVVQPRPVWREEYKRSLLAYEILEQKPKVTKTFFSTEDSDPAKFQHREFRKFTTMLAEVKHAVATARTWLVSGVAADCIAIASPDIETYWPVLCSYLDQEGIPSQKPKVARLHGFPDIAQWMSTLRLRTGGHGEADLEVSLYEHASVPTLSYEKFKVLFSAVYSREDLERDSGLAKLYSIELKESQLVDRDTFVAWSLKSLPETADRLRVETILKKLFSECPEITTLQTSRWMNYLEELATRTEVRIRDGLTDGVSCINLESCENSPASHMILLGLTESALKSGADTAILFGDIQSLAYEYGFHLQSQDQAKLEFEARWVIDNSSRELVLSVPETDFDGAVQAPAWLWVKGTQEAKLEVDVTLPDRTRWDEIQHASLDWISDFRKWNSDRKERLQNSLNEDLGFAPLPDYAAGKVERLSASAIEDYQKCPFIFAAKRLFRLSDLPTLDLDVDPSTRGKLLHAIFERLTREPMQFDFKRAELDQIVELAREQAEVKIYDERLWPSMRMRYVDIAQRFLNFEKDWRRQFPKTKTLDREVMVKGFVDRETGELINEPRPGAITFTGMIDRIDTDNEGNAAVIDYKSSASRLKQHGSWIEEHQLQLLLYALAFENKLTAHDPQNVVSAVYYVARNMDRDIGFKLTDIDQGLYAIEGQKKNKVSLSDRNKMFQEVTEIIKRVVANMHVGRFQPIPYDTKICITCQWSAVCRAPHLNT